ncbi:hypothetical protein AF42_03419 [Citrobacter freundii MGH 56]|nr:hypothetical protein AF42_03419 [Citrobacter freundii MGH 56]
MNTLTFLLSTVIELYTMALLLRVWMQWSRCDFYNPFSQFIVKITQPIIGPLRRIIPPMGPIDSASALVALVLSFIKAIVLFKVVTFQPIIWIAAVLTCPEDYRAADFLGTAGDGDYELGQPGPQPGGVRADSTGGSAAAPNPSHTSRHGRDRFLPNDSGSAALCD